MLNCCTTREKARIERDNKIRSLGFCPLINGRCEISCVCFVAPEITEKSEDKGEGAKTYYYFYSPYCGNEMFYKEEYNVNCRY